MATAEYYHATNNYENTVQTLRPIDANVPSSAHKSRGASYSATPKQSQKNTSRRPRSSNRKDTSATRQNLSNFDNYSHGKYDYTKNLNPMDGEK